MNVHCMDDPDEKYFFSYEAQSEAGDKFTSGIVVMLLPADEV